MNHQTQNKTEQKESHGLLSPALQWVAIFNKEACYGERSFYYVPPSVPFFSISIQSQFLFSPMAQDFQVNTKSI
jgi:hypothetical protein